jgi:hypothetical protein
MFIWNVILIKVYRMRKSQRNKKRKYQRKTKRYLGGNNAYPSPGLQFKYNVSAPKIQRGGVNLTTSNSVTSFVGNAWTPSSWPGVNGSSNYLAPNNYPTDVQLGIQYNNYV